MLINIKDQLTPALREELAEEFERVLAKRQGIAATHLFDRSMQRVVLTLPKGYVHMAKFLALLEIEELPASLRLWQFACENEGQAAAMERNLGRMMRAYLEEVLMIRIGVEMCELKTALKANGDR